MLRVLARARVPTYTRYTIAATSSSLAPHANTNTTTTMANILNECWRIVRENPRTTATVATVTGTALVGAVPAIIIAPVLAPLGFVGSAIVPGSIATGIQAGIGNVAAGSVFAFIQSAAAGGYGAAAIGAASGTVSGVVATGAVVKKWFGS